MNAYVQWVTAHPMFSAIVHFAILGTLGEHVAALLAAPATCPPPWPPESDGPSPSPSSRTCSSARR